MRAAAARVKPITAHERARREAGLTLTAIGIGVGCKHPYVSRVEAGLIPASDRYRRGFAKLCGVAVNEVFGPDGRVLA